MTRIAQPNILVNASGNALITDFDLASIFRDPNSVKTGAGEYGYTPRWAAPEMFGKNPTPSKESDIFSFAMVAIEVGGWLVLGILATLPVNSGVLWGGSLPWHRIYCGSGNDYEGRSSRPARSPQFDQPFVGPDPKLLGT